MTFSNYTAANLVAESQLTNVVLPAYDMVFEWVFRSQPVFRTWADKRPVHVNNPGDSVVFSVNSDMALATTPLVENQTPDPTPLPNPTRVTVSLDEYGQFALKTLRISEVAFSDIDRTVPEALAHSAADSIDSLVQSVMRTNGLQIYRRAAAALTYQDYTGGGTVAAQNTITPTDVIKSGDIRRIVGRMRTNKVLPRLGGGLYIGALHPMVSVDLREETGAAAWRDPHVYPDGTQGNIWDAVVGQYEGCVFVENPRMYTAQLGATVSSVVTRVYYNWFLGAQALAEAVNVDVHMVAGEITDPLRRFQPLGWHAFLGWNVFRQESLVRYETSSSAWSGA